MERYEALRTEVLTGQALPEGLSALVSHGMLRGLALILSDAPVLQCPQVARESSVHSIPHDPQFVRLLANMLLRSQSEVVHVY